MPKQRSTTRQQRRKEQHDNYLAGKSSRPYQHTPSLNKSFCDAQPGTSASGGICSKCYPVLSRWQDTFKRLIHQGSERKKRKNRYPSPKRKDIGPYRDLKAQNSWLINNVFDSLGNYLYCCRCICAAFQVSPQRLARQRKMKRDQFQSPTKVMPKYRERAVGELCDYAHWL